MAELRRQAVAVEDHLLEGWEDQQVGVLSARKGRTPLKQEFGCVLHRTGWSERLLHQEEHSSVLGNIRDLRWFVPDIDQLQPRNHLNTSDMTLACAFAFSGNLHLFALFAIALSTRSCTDTRWVQQRNNALIVWSRRNSRLSYDFRSIA